MQSSDLAAVFSRRYHQAADGEMVTSIHIFGIEYAEQLAGQNIKEVCERANVTVSYQTEISKGMSLAKFVELKND